MLDTARRRPLDYNIMLTGGSQRVAKRSLILAGGGVKVAYQAGVLQVWLDEAGLTFDHADGASGGVFNLAMYCQGMSGSQIAERWRRFPVLRSIGFNWAQFIRFYWSESLLTYDKFRKLVLRKHWNLDWDKIKSSARPGTFNVYNFTKNKLVVVDHSGMSEDLLVACVTLPMWFAPVTIDGDRYIDGVYLTDANLMEAIRRGADELWIIWTVSRKARWRGGFIDTYFQIIETVANGHLQRDLDRIEANNKAIETGRAGEFGRPIKVEMLAAEVPLHYLVNVASPDFSAAVEQGIADARAWCRERGIALTSDAGKGHELMALTFRETMKGPFALDAADPEEGRKKGLAAGTSLALHGHIRIDAFDRFVNDSNHTGLLTGTIDFDTTPFANGMPALKGVFNLFKPAGKSATAPRGLFRLFRSANTDTGHLKHFIYELVFTHGGKSYYLAGHKDVREGGEPWGDTTTLYTRLYEGGDATGKVIGAGVLTLGVSELLDLLSTVEVHNAKSEPERIAVITRFGRLFLGELWDSYARFVPGVP
jgi:predicted acylesterase/phospholipase RssA